MARKLFMIPKTVPKRPTNGPTAPIDAKSPVPERKRITAPASIRSNAISSRSRDEARRSVVRAGGKAATSPCAARDASDKGQSPGNCTNPMPVARAACARRSCRKARANSTDLNRKTVNTAATASARRPMTACTTQCAFRTRLTRSVSTATGTSAGALTAAEPGSTGAASISAPAWPSTGASVETTGGLAPSCAMAATAKRKKQDVAAHFTM